MDAVLGLADLGRPGPQVGPLLEGDLDQLVHGVSIATRLSGTSGPVIGRNRTEGSRFSRWVSRAAATPTPCSASMTSARR